MYPSSPNARPVRDHCYLRTTPLHTPPVVQTGLESVVRDRGHGVLRLTQKQRADGRLPSQAVTPPNAPTTATSARMVDCPGPRIVRIGLDHAASVLDRANGRTSETRSASSFRVIARSQIANQAARPLSLRTLSPAGIFPNCSQPCVAFEHLRKLRRARYDGDLGQLDFIEPVNRSAYGALLDAGTLTTLNEVREGEGGGVASSRRSGATTRQIR